MEESSDWDMTKENIRPIRQGRAAESASFAEIVDPKHSSDLKQKRSELEAAIESYQGEDPLASWITLIDWIESVYPKGGSQAGLSQLLQKCAMKFYHDGKHSKKYYDDPRFIKVWIKLASYADAIKAYQFMFSHEIGHKRPEMYCEWARELESKNNVAEAEKVLERGLSFCCGDAEHTAKLESARRLIFDRNARTLFESNFAESIASEEDRSMLGGLRPVGKEKKIAPINRIGDSKISAKPVVSSHRTKIQSVKISVHASENRSSYSADRVEPPSPQPGLPFLLPEPDRENLVGAVKLAKGAVSSVRKPFHTASSAHLGFRILADPEEPPAPSLHAEEQLVKRPLSFRTRPEESPVVQRPDELKLSPQSSEHLWDVEKYNDPSPSCPLPPSQRVDLDQKESKQSAAPPPSTATTFAWNYQLFLSGMSEYSFEENLGKRARKKREAEAVARVKEVEKNTEEKERLIEEKLKEVEVERQAAVELRKSLEDEIKLAEDVKMKAENLWDDAERKLRAAEDVMNLAETSQREAEHARAEALRLHQEIAEERQNSESILQEARELQQSVQAERELCEKMRAEAEEMNRTVEDDLLLCENILQVTCSCLTSLKCDVDSDDVDLTVGVDNFLARLQRKLGRLTADEHKNTGVASINMMLVVLEELRASLVQKYAQESESMECFPTSESIPGEPLAQDCGELFEGCPPPSLAVPRQSNRFSVDNSYSWQSSQPISTVAESQREGTNSRIYAMWNQSVADVSREKSSAECWPLPDLEEQSHSEPVLPVRQAITWKKTAKSLHTAAADPENANYSVDMEVHSEEDLIPVNPVKPQQRVFQIFQDKSVEENSSALLPISHAAHKASPVSLGAQFEIFHDVSSIRRDKSDLSKHVSVSNLSISQTDKSYSIPQTSVPSEVSGEALIVYQSSILTTTSEPTMPPPAQPSEAEQASTDSLEGSVSSREALTEPRKSISTEALTESDESSSPQSPARDESASQLTENAEDIAVTEDNQDVTSPLSSQESNYTSAPTQPLIAPTFFTACTSGLEVQMSALSFAESVDSAFEIDPKVQPEEPVLEVEPSQTEDASKVECVVGAATFQEAPTTFGTANPVVKVQKACVVQETAPSTDNREEPEKEDEENVGEEEDESMVCYRRQGAFADMQDEFNQTRKSFGFAEQTFQIVSETQFVSNINQRCVTSTPKIEMMTFGNGDEDEDEESTDQGPRRPQLPRISYVASHYVQALSPIIERSRENKTSSSSGSSGTATHLRFSKKSTLNCSPLKEHDEAHPVDPYDPEVLESFKIQVYVRLDEDDKVQRITEAMPKIAVKSVIKLAGQKYKIGEELGSGNYAVVYSLRCRSDATISWAMKVQKMYGWWDYYIHSTILRRVHELPEGEVYLQNIIKAISFHQMEGGKTFTLLPLFEEGHLVSLINRFQKSPDKTLPELLAMKLTIDVLRAVEALHVVNIIHGDIKADNFLVQDSKALVSDKIHTIDDLLNLPTLVLTDFGCGIDMSMFGPTVTFSSVRKGKTTSGFEILASKPWTYQIDLLGIVDVMHCLLFGDYMKLHEQGGVWRISKSFKRAWSGIWARTFQRLLNIESSDDIPCLTELRKEFEQEARTHFKSSEIPKLLRNARVSLFMQRKSCFIQN